MAGRKHKQKGDRVERKVVQLHKNMGILAERIPLSGAAGGSFSGDLKLFIWGGEAATAEVKGRKTGSGWKTIRDWLANNDLLFLVEDFQEPLVVLPWTTYKELLKHSDDTAIKDIAPPEAEGAVSWGDYYS